MGRLVVFLVGLFCQCVWAVTLDDVYQVTRVVKDQSQAELESASQQGFVHVLGKVSGLHGEYLKRPEIEAEATKAWNELFDDSEDR